MSLSDLCAYPQSRAQRIKQISVLVFLTVISALPFINKAYHIDDVHFMEAARRLFDFKHFYTTPFYSFGERFESAIDFSHPLVVPYILNGVMRAVPNADEAVFHGVFLVFTVFAVVFTYLFCLRFSLHPFIITLLFLFSPAFYVLSHNLMSDIVLYSFIVSSIVCFVHAVDHEKRGFLAGAIVLFALALGAGFQSLVFYSAFFFYSYFRQPRALAWCWGMGLSCLPVLSLFAFQFVEVKHLPNPINFNLLNEAGRLAKYLYFACHLSLAYLSPIGLAIVVFGKNHIKTAIISGFLALIALLGFQVNVIQGYSFFQEMGLYTGLLFTFLAFGLIFKKFPRSNNELAGQKNSDRKFLLFTTATFLVICVVFTPFGANRYLIPIMPFILVLMVWNAEVFRVQWALTAVVVSMVISICAAKSDYDLAAFYKKLAAAHISPVEHSWFTGEWGVRDYMVKAGYKYLTFDSNAGVHDLIVEPTTMARMDLVRFKQPVRLKTIYQYNEKQNFLRLLSFRDHIGFWSQGWGLLPFWPSDRPLEEIRVYEVMPETVPFNLLTTSDSFALPADMRLEKRVLDGKAREVLLQNGKPGFAFSLQPPQAWRMRFGLGFTVPPDGAKEASATFRITAVSGEERKVLFDHHAVSADKDHATWSDSEVDLTPYKGRIVKLVFQISGVPSNAEAFWSSLSLVEEKEASLE